jgi:cellulose synthase/poly-beta-1,6-N-acetylglucosamine synthase-like glycosyltransferase
MEILSNTSYIQMFDNVLLAIGTILIVSNLFYVFLLIAATIRIRKEKMNHPFLNYRTLPVTLVVPAYNEEKSIEQSVKSFLNQDYPVFEIILINDGSKDKTAEIVLKMFHFEPLPVPEHFKLGMGKVKAMYFCEEKNITFVDKENSGKADSLNFGIELSKYEYICTVDADSILSPFAFRRTCWEFIKTPETLACGSAIRVFNGAEIKENGEIAYTQPKSLLEFCQMMEYKKSFYTGRLGWDLFKSTMIISGAFGMYKKSALLEVGGYDRDSVGEDMDLIIRMHKHFLKKKIEYVISYIPDPLCLTEVPSDFATLSKQRNRWQRGLMESIFKGDTILFSNGKSFFSRFAIPFYIFTEIVSPIVEVTSYLMIAFGLYFNLLNWKVVLLFLIISILFSSIISLSVTILDEKTFSKSVTVFSAFKILMVSIIMNIGYRQFITLQRLSGMVDFYLKRKDWGRMNRRGFLNK